MTEEQKQLLLKDLSCRIPYGVIVNVDENHKVMMESVTWYEEVSVDDGSNDLYTISEVRPYLRPMSSMTEEESEKYEEFLELQAEYTTGADIQFKYNMFDWLNANHFDYRGLIEKGLAIEAPEGMYD